MECNNINYIDVDKKTQNFEYMYTINSFFSHLTIVINSRNILFSSWHNLTSNYIKTSISQLAGHVCI